MGWIKIEKHLIHKPEVYALAKKMGLPIPHVVGLLVVFWGWVDDHVASHSNCRVPHLDAAAIDSIVGHSGFCSAMIECSWIDLKNGEMQIPKMDRHLSKVAKCRSLDARNRSKARAKVRQVQVSCAKQDKCLVDVLSMSCSEEDREEKRKKEEEKRREKEYTEKEKRREAEIKEKRRDSSPVGGVGTGVGIPEQTTWTGVPLESLQADYNRVIKNKGFPQSKLLNDRIRQAYKVRCREIPDFAKLFLAEVAQLAEFVQEGHWFDFGWAITSPENARKLLEGKYRGVREVQPVRKTQEQLLEEYHATTGVPRRDKPASLPPQAARD